MHKLRNAICSAAILLSMTTPAFAQTPIDRHALVSRHDVVLTSADPKESLQVGNGGFAFGMDCTGLQTFYGNTMADWGWHSNPLPAGQTPEDFRFKEYDAQGRKVGYMTDKSGQEELFNWLRENPHRFNLGRLRMRLLHADGTLAKVEEITNINQRLELWKSLVTSEFVFDGEPVKVETVADSDSDTIAVKVQSKLLGQGRLSINLEFPAPSPDNDGANWDAPAKHSTTMTMNGANRADFARAADEMRYQVSLAWQGARPSIRKNRTFTICVPKPESMN